MIEKDRVAIEKGAGLKIKEPYLTLLKRVEQEALLERQQLRKYIYDQKLKGIVLERNGTFTAYLFICQNREENLIFSIQLFEKKLNIF